MFIDFITSQAILTLQNNAIKQGTRDAYRFWHQYHPDSCHITTGRAIKLSKIANTTSAIVRHDFSFIDLLKSTFHCQHMFETEYGVSLRRCSQLLH